MLSFDNLMGAKVDNLRRLAKALGLGWGQWAGLPDERHQLAVAIARWYKRHPAPRCKRRA
jgi:hypothetical protein